MYMFMACQTKTKIIYQEYTIPAKVSKMKDHVRLLQCKAVHLAEEHLEYY